MSTVKGVDGCWLLGVGCWENEKASRFREAKSRQLTANSLNGVHDRVAKSLPLPQIRAPVLVVLRHQRVVLVEPPLPLVHLLRLEEVRIVDARNLGRHEVSEVGVALPLDRSLGDRL